MNQNEDLVENSINYKKRKDIKMLLMHKIQTEIKIKINDEKENLNQKF